MYLIMGKRGGTFQLFYKIKKESFAGGGRGFNIYNIYIEISQFSIYILYIENLSPRSHPQSITYVYVIDKGSGGERQYLNGGTLESVGERGEGGGRGGERGGRGDTRVGGS